MRKLTITTAVLLLAAAALAGCSDDGVAPTQAPTTTGTVATTNAPPTTTAPAATAPPATTEPVEAEFGMTSPAFQDGGDIPIAFTCEGANDSPELAWTGVPGGTTSLALAVVDPDGGDWIHWIAWNIPPDSTGMAMNVAAGGLPDGTRQGANDFADVLEAGDLFPGGGEIRIEGWDGPCPGPQPHRYFFTLYALTGTIDLPTGTPGIDILDAIEAARADGSLIASTTILGMFPPR